MEVSRQPSIKLGLFFFFNVFWLLGNCSRQAVSSLTRDQTQAPCIGNLEFYPLDHQGSPLAPYLKKYLEGLL